VALTVPCLRTSVRLMSSQTEGSVAKSKEWGTKERAHENQFARQREAEQLQKLKIQLQKAKEALAELEHHHRALHKSHEERWDESKWVGD